MGHMRQAEQAFRNALSYAERGDYAAEKAEAIGWLLLSTVSSDQQPLGTGSLSATSRRVEKNDPTIQAWCSVARAVLEAMRGEQRTRARELLTAHRLARSRGSA